MALCRSSDPWQVESMERQQSEAELQHPAREDLVVFSILRDSQCVECGEALWKGKFLFMEKERPLHAPISITSSTCPVVMLRSHDAPRSTAPFRRWSSDSAGLGATTSAKASWSKNPHFRKPNTNAFRTLARGRLGASATKYAVSNRITICAPTSRMRSGSYFRAVRLPRRLPLRNTRRRAEAAGWDAPPAGKTLDKRAITAAAIAAIRHTHTRYDELLMSGFDRADARDAVREAVDRVLDIWRKPA